MKLRYCVCEAKRVGLCDVITVLVISTLFVQLIHTNYYKILSGVWIVQVHDPHA